MSIMTFYAHFVIVPHNVVENLYAAAVGATTNPLRVSVYFKTRVLIWLFLSSIADQAGLSLGGVLLTLPPKHWEDRPTILCLVLK